MTCVQLHASPIPSFAYRKADQQMRARLAFQNQCTLHSTKCLTHVRNKGMACIDGCPSASSYEKASKCDDSGPAIVEASITNS